MPLYFALLFYPFPVTVLIRQRKGVITGLIFRKGLTRYSMIPVIRIRLNIPPTVKLPVTALFLKIILIIPYWINLDFPRFNGRVYLSYKSIGGTSVYKVKTATGYRDSLVSNTFDGLREEAYRMTFKHTLKASGIIDSAFETKNGIPGMYFKVEGNAATSRQFYVTDSLRHFLRGALYFDTAPNADSLSIVNDFLETDMRHLIETLKWRVGSRES